LIDTVAWVRVERGRILCARPRGKDIFYIPGGKREAAENDLETLLREVKEVAWFTYRHRELVPLVDQLLFDELRATGQLS
jgi:ADP-ribose pyrophosphatase YjhB (NUDIX family)